MRDSTILPKKELHGRVGVKPTQNPPYRDGGALLSGAPTDALNARSPKLWGFPKQWPENIYLYRRVCAYI